MATLMDRLDKFASSYIRRTPAKEEKISNVVDPLLKADEWSQTLEKYEPYIGVGKNRVKLTSTMCRKLALSCPLFIKGVKKKSQDTFRAGFDIKKGDKNIIGQQGIWINKFNKRNNILSLLEETKVNVHIYGYGIWLIQFYNELISQKDGKKINYEQPPNENAEPWKLTLLNSETVDKFEYKNKNWQKRGIKHLKIKNNNGDTHYIHPDRIVPFAEKKLGFSMFGISDVVILRHIIDSSSDIDIATGKILKWSSRGITEWKKINASPDEQKEMLRILNTHPDAYASSDDYTLNVHNPEAIDPSPYYNYIKMCIAAVLVMPTHVLTGIEVGRVTGAEAGFSDYHRDISDNQNLVYAPPLKSLYQRIFDAKGAQLKDKKFIFDYAIVWNPTYVNELAEIELYLKRADIVSKLMATKMSKAIITVEEARKILNEGYTKLDVKKKIKQEANKGKAIGNFKPKSPSATEKASYTKLIENAKEKFSNLELTDGELEELSQEIRIRKSKEE